MKKAIEYLKSILFKQVEPNVNGIPLWILEEIETIEKVSSKIQMPFEIGMKKTLDEFSVPEGSTMDSLTALTDAPLNQWIDFENLKWNHKKTYSYILNHSGDFSKPSNNIAECLIDDHLVWWYYNEQLDVCKIKLHKKLTLKN